MKRNRWSTIVAFSLCVSLVPGAAQSQTLYWIDTNFPAPLIGMSDTNGAGIVTVPLGAGTLPEGIDYDPVADQVYWTEAAFSGARIMRAEANLSGITVIDTGGSVYRGLALELGGGKLYWTSSNHVIGAGIHRSNLDGTGVVDVLGWSGNFNPRGIALYPGAGKMYWADFDQDLIRRADLSGANVEDVVTLRAGSGPWGVDLNVAMGLLFWTEYNTGTVSSSTLDGASVVTLVSGLANPTYLALDNEKGAMFWIEAASGVQKIQKAKQNGAGVTDLGIPHSSLGGIVVAPLGPVIDVAEDPALEFSLAPIAPNPAVGSVLISYTLPLQARTHVAIVDVRGRKVVTLVNETQEAGRHQATWNGPFSGNRNRAGLYFVILRAGDEKRVRRLVYLP